MSIMTTLADKARSPGDPKVLSMGPSPVPAADRAARALGWFSIGLGVSELLFAHRYTRALGVDGSEGAVRLCGLREIGAGVLSLSASKSAGLWSRVGGDALDLALIGRAMRDGRPGQRGNAALALVTVLGITALDVMVARALTSQHSRGGQRPRDYSERSGFPGGLERARGVARDFSPPREYEAFEAPEEAQPQRVPPPRGDGGALRASAPPS